LPPDGVALKKKVVALVWYCAVGTWTQGPVGDVPAFNTHPK
jgi:hypothetical protein